MASSGAATIRQVPLCARMVRRSNHWYRCRRSQPRAAGCQQRGLRATGTRLRTPGSTHTASWSNRLARCVSIVPSENLERTRARCHPGCRGGCHASCPRTCCWVREPWCACSAPKSATALRWRCSPAGGWSRCRTSSSTCSRAKALSVRHAGAAVAAARPACCNPAGPVASAVSFRHAGAGHCKVLQAAGLQGRHIHSCSTAPGSEPGHAQSQEPHNPPAGTLMLACPWQENSDALPAHMSQAASSVLPEHLRGGGGGLDPYALGCRPRSPCMEGRLACMELRAVASASASRSSLRASKAAPLPCME